MKSKDLMIGDWVLNRINKVPMQVGGICEDELIVYTRYAGSCINCSYEASLLGPIPITKEILEQNGFSYTEEPYTGVVLEPGTWQLEDSRVDVDNWTSNSGDDSWCVHVDNDCFDTIGCVDVRYVHELQHVLNLCGVSKEFCL